MQANEEKSHWFKCIKRMTCQSLTTEIQRKELFFWGIFCSWCVHITCASSTDFYVTVGSSKVTTMTWNDLQFWAVFTMSSPLPQAAAHWSLLPAAILHTSVCLLSACICVCTFVLGVKMCVLHVPAYINPQVFSYAWLIMCVRSTQGMHAQDVA